MAENDNTKETGAGNAAPKADEKATPKVDEKATPKAEAKVEVPEKQSETRELVNMLAAAMQGNAPARQGTAEDFPLSETTPGGKYLVNHKWRDAEGKLITDLSDKEKEIADKSMKAHLASLRKENQSELEPGEL